MAGEFVDLMAFARGAELANKANWQDTLNDINARAGEEKLRQQQTTYDLNLPVAQLKSEQAYGAELGNRAQAEFQTGALAEMSKMPPEQQAGFLADSVSKRLQNIQAMGPGAGNELQGLQNFVARQAQDYIKAGDVASAQRLYAALPGAGQAQANRAGDLLKWSDPKTALDPLNLATEAANLGWKYDPKTDTVAQPNGTSMRGYEFANMKRTQANYVLSDMTPGLQRVQERTMAEQGAEALAKQYQAAGYMTWINPVTNQVIPLDHSGKPVAQGTGPAAAPQNNTATVSSQAQAYMPDNRDIGGGFNPAGAVPTGATSSQAQAYMPNNIDVGGEFNQGAAPWEPAGQMLDQARIRKQQAQNNLYSFGLQRRAADPAGYQKAMLELSQAEIEERQMTQQYQSALPTYSGQAVQMSPQADQAAFMTWVRNQSANSQQAAPAQRYAPAAMPQYPPMVLPPQAAPQIYNTTPPGWMTNGR